MESLSNALRDALEMERNGREFYLDAAQQVRDEVVRSVLVALAADEEAHERIISRYYKALQTHKAWPEPDETLDDIPPPEHVKHILEATVGRIGSDAQFLGVYETACELEINSRDYYLAKAGASEDANVREFFGFLARVEQAHFDALQTMARATQG